MSLLQNRPNLLLGLLLGGVLIVALTFGYFNGYPTPSKQVSHPDAPIQFPYQLAAPTSLFELPRVLTEISGLAPWSPQQVLCVQDEKGKVYLFDLEENSIVDRWDFDKNRDYEGIAKKDSQIYVLENDGDLYNFTYRANNQSFESIEIETAFKLKHDLEGLCYDARYDQLLLVPKAQNLHSSDENKHLKGIYRFNLDRGELDPIAAYHIDEYELGQLVYGEDRRFHFKPSAIAVHPTSGDLYLLSAVTESLIVLSRESKLMHYQKLDASTFPQPEGICFLSGERLVISSEGHGGKANLAVFEKLIP